MTAYQEQRIKKLETLLQKTEKYLSIIATDSFIYTEKFYECMYCESDVPDEHTENCVSLEALELRLAVERALLKHHIQSGG